MDIKRLRAFVTVAEHGTVSKAAQILHVTQPALSRQIAAFERDLGFNLFQRVGRRLTLTPRAEQLLGDCRGLLTTLSALAERAQALRRGEIKVLRIAASALTIEGTFPSFLHRFGAQFPEVRLSLVEADAAEHLDLLEGGVADLAVNVINVVQVDDHRFGSHLLPRFHIVAACSSSFDAGAPDTIEIRELVRFPLLLPNASYATRNLFDAACRLAGVRPDVFVESGSSHALLALAEAGHGVAIIPSILRTDRSAVRTLRVTHRGELLQIALAVLWDKRRTLPRFAQEFSQALAEHIGAVFPAATTTLKNARTQRQPPSRTGTADERPRLNPRRDHASSPPASRRSRERAR
jgi:LysR family transcriptional regulator, nitrogen assimilation regulatory protein